MSLFSFRSLFRDVRRRVSVLVPFVRLVEWICCWLLPTTTAFLSSLLFAFSEMDDGKRISLCSWNVHGLNDGSKCSGVLAELLPLNLAVAALQETKLVGPNRPKIHNFLPRHLAEYVIKDAIGRIITAWNTTVLALDSTISNPYSLTTDYAPTQAYDKPAFLAELVTVQPALATPWVVPRTRTMITSPPWKPRCSTTYLTSSNLLKFLCMTGPTALHYARSNMRANPTLVRLWSRLRLPILKRDVTQHSALVPYSPGAESVWLVFS